MLLLIANLRYLWRHPLLSLLTLIGIALGVAVVVAMDVVNDSALRSFQKANQIIAGSSTHKIYSDDKTFSETLYTELKVRQGIESAIPLLNAEVSLQLGVKVQAYQLIGLDLLAVRSQQKIKSSNANPTLELLTVPNTGLMLTSTAKSLDVALGSQVLVHSTSKSAHIKIIGFINPGNELQAHFLSNAIITDLATAQEILDMPGKLSSIELTLPDSIGGKRQLNEIKTLLQTNQFIVSSQSRSNALADMTKAFRTNLFALSLLALLIGMLLIYNTMVFSVVRRRQFIATLRTIGVTRQQIFFSILFEAFVIGILATLMGWWAGLTLAKELLSLVTLTINDLYFTLEVMQITLDWGNAAKALSLGIGATLLSAWLPAWEATRAVPGLALHRSTLEAGRLRHYNVAAVIGLVLIACSAALLTIPSRSLGLGFMALFLGVFGFALSTPKLATMLLSVLETPIKKCFGLVGNLATRSIQRSLSRTGIAIAALCVAISVTIGIGIMIDSFRSSVESWLWRSLTADLYLRINTGRSNTGFSTQFIELLKSREEVSALRQGRLQRVETAIDTKRVYILDADLSGFQNYHFKQGDAKGAWRKFQQGQGVLVSEPYAYRHQLKLGDPVKLFVHGSSDSLPVLGIYYDYASDLGTVVIDRNTYERRQGPVSMNSIALTLHANVDINSFIQSLRNSNQLPEGLEVRSAKTIRDKSLQLFDRTFTITALLRMVAIVVAMVGILCALLSIQLERAREIAMLRANGLTVVQLWAIVSAETGLIGLIAGLLALPLGTLMAMALTHVINYRAFGWSLNFVLDPHICLQGVILGVVAALIAGLYPAYKISRTPLTTGLREE